MSPIELWAVDFEYSTCRVGEIDVICMVAMELRSGTVIRLWGDELRTHTRCPFPTGSNSIVIGYQATAEMRCFQELGWSQPRHVICLRLEYRCLTNRYEEDPHLKKHTRKASLVQCLNHFEIHHPAGNEKAALQKLCAAGGPFSHNEKARVSRCVRLVVASNFH